MKKIFFIGIGGIGMSSLALYAKFKKYIVQGCDINITNDTILLLKKNYIPVYQEKNITENQIIDQNIIVITNTITEDHPIYILAKKYNKIVYLRSQFLQKILKEKKVIAITGSHGKTTTTGITGDLLYKTYKKPTVLVGGIYKEYSTNIIINKSPYVVLEADDAYKSFLDLSPFISVITSIGYEHLETYLNMEDILNHFYKFATLTNKKGIIIINNDITYNQELIERLKKNNFKNIITYGINKTSDYQITNIKNLKKGNSFNILHNNSIIGKYQTPLSGLANIKNTTCAIIIAYFLSLKTKMIQKKLKNYFGVERRFEYIGCYKNIPLYDDYGHHPTEIETIFNVIKEQKKIAHIFFQPHKYIRTKHLWNEFITVFTKNKEFIKNLFITDVYAINEEIDPFFNSSNLVLEINKVIKNTFYIPFDKDFNNFNEYINKLNNNSHNEIILTLGAGIMNQLAKKIAK